LLSSVKTLFISELIGNGFDKNPEGLCAKRESMEVDEVVCRQLWAFTFFFPYFRGFSTCSCHMLSCFLTSLLENLSSTCTCCTRMLCLGRGHPGALSPALEPRKEKEQVGTQTSANTGTSKQSTLCRCRVRILLLIKLMNLNLAPILSHQFCQVSIKEVGLKAFVVLCGKNRLLQKQVLYMFLQSKHLERI
jgi:hypothetical protein